MYKTLSYLSLIFLLSACSPRESDSINPSSEQESLETIGAPAEPLATNLDIPWMITKQDEIFYLSQREGKIIEMNVESQSKEIQNLSLTKEVLHQGEGGFLGFILAPDFEETQQAFAYHTYLDEGKIQNRIVTLQKEGNTWIESKELLAGIPGASNHNGGRMKIGPDRMLYVTTGDAAIPELAQNKNSLAGKILRLTLDGTIPDDNPFQDSYIYSYGHRNPQGLAWDNQGVLYSTEHGQSAHDEINLIEPGENYGWPVIQGDEEQTGMKNPIFHTSDTTWAPSGIAFDNGKLYIATLRDSRIRSFDLATKSVSVIHENSGRMRDIYIDGKDLYTITNNRDGRGQPGEDDDKLLRIRID